MPAGVAVRINDAPDELATSAISVEVTESLGQPTYYRLEYALDSVDGDFPFLTEQKFGPGSDLSIVVGSDCLVKGPVYGQHIRFEHGGSGSTLVVQGADSLIKLDREDKVAAWQGTDSAAVSSILGDPQVGFTPDVQNTTPSHVELKHTLIQRETDLSFVRRLARRNGFHFWLTCNELGIETAHFKR